MIEMTDKDKMIAKKLEAAGMVPKSGSISRGQRRGHLEYIEFRAGGVLQATYLAGYDQNKNLVETWWERNGVKITSK